MFQRLLAAPLPDSPPGWVSLVSRFEGGPRPGVTLASSSAGLLVPVARTGKPPGQRGLSTRVRAHIFTLCQTLRGPKKKGFGWRHSASAPWPAGGTSEPIKEVQSKKIEVKDHGRCSKTLFCEAC